MLLPASYLLDRYVERAAFWNRKDVVSSFTLITGLAVADSKLPLLVVPPAKDFCRNDDFGLFVNRLRPNFASLKKIFLVWL
jgi:hypothetical protein